MGSLTETSTEHDTGTKTERLIGALAGWLTAIDHRLKHLETTVYSAPLEASLQIDPPENYIGGQGLYWSGNIGATGVRTIKLQRHQGREGYDWEDVEEFSEQADSAGNFGFWWPAPAMRTILYRVASGTPAAVGGGGEYATPSIEMMAVQPDVILWVSGKKPANPEDIGSAVAGKPFDISVDTTPKLTNRGDTKGLQPIPGRGLTLQRRVPGKGDEWDTLDTSVVEDDGMGYFTGVVEKEAGDVVYRVRMEDWTENKSEIGWFPSFPTYVTIWGANAAAGPSMASASQPVSEDSASDESSSRAEVAPTYAKPEPTAAQCFHWQPSYYDFSWVGGESLTSPPRRGQNRQGGWLDYTDGGGRVCKDGGGLLLDSKRLYDAGPGDFGTMKATLQGNPMQYGRWEIKLWPKSLEDGCEDYRLLLELVPEEDPEDATRTITVADFTVRGTTVNFGVPVGNKRWSGSYEVGVRDGISSAWAIEVTEDHITWFFEGEPIGTATDVTAIPVVPMTIRISMVGDGEAEMNAMTFKSDWQRAFTLDSGKTCDDGAPLTKTTV